MTGSGALGRFTTLLGWGNSSGFDSQLGTRTYRRRYIPPCLFSLGFLVRLVAMEEVMSIGRLAVLCLEIGGWAFERWGVISGLSMGYDVNVCLVRMYVVFVFACI